MLLWAIVPTTITNWWKWSSTIYVTNFARPSKTMSKLIRTSPILLTIRWVDRIYASKWNKLYRCVFFLLQITDVQLQIGIPDEITKTDAFVNAYYKEFLYSKMHFIDHLESHWSFERKKIEEQLSARSRTEKLISNLFPMTDTEQRHRLVQYSVDLNTIIVSEQAVHKPYFHHKYPM